MRNNLTPLVFAVGLLVAVVLVVRPGARDTVDRQRDAVRTEDTTSKVRIDSTPVDPAAGRTPSNGEPLNADFVHLYDVSSSVRTGGANDPFLEAVRQLLPSIEALRTDDLLLPQRHRVGSIGAASLMQSPLCDVRLEPIGIFVRTETSETNARLRACNAALHSHVVENATDIRGALHYASLSLKGGRPMVRGIVLVSDLAEFVPRGQGLATPDLSGICVAVYSLVTPEAVTHPDSLAAREARWRSQLLAWRAARVQVQSMLGFNAGDLTTFFRTCRPGRRA
jgi:hypothetical protein